MPIAIPCAQVWAERCAEDGEFVLASRYWTGGLVLSIGQDQLTLGLNNGEVSSTIGANQSGVVEYSGPVDVWQDILQPTPKRFHNDLMANISTAGGIQREGDALVHAQYYAAIMRAVELLRDGPSDAASSTDHHPDNVSEMNSNTHANMRIGDIAPMGHIDEVVGRYVHVQLGGCDHRIYFEEAGQGTPILLQHTAGCHSSQWRHLFEMPEITSRFRLIAYDLPYHGKSLPPVEEEWWSKRYRLEGEYLRAVPLAMAQALGLHNPIFMGCSVGGLLALDLAARHPDSFNAVISVEGALKIEGNMEHLGTLWHPQVSNEYKARLMEGLMSPTSPTPYRKETSFVYSCGWPPVFLGDLHYYIEDYDLRDSATQIDTSKVGVHIMSGEYDYSGRSEFGRAAHEAIAGSTFVEMEGVGHFPMSENPLAFQQYLMPILEQLA